MNTNGKTTARDLGFEHLFGNEAMNNQMAKQQELLQNIAQKVTQTQESVDVYQHQAKMLELATQKYMSALMGAAHIAPLVEKLAGDPNVRLSQLAQVSIERGVDIVEDRIEIIVSDED